MLDAASMPQKPYNSMQRLGILLAGPLGGLALGLALVAFVEYRDSSFKSEDEVERLLTAAGAGPGATADVRSRPQGAPTAHSDVGDAGNHRRD